MNKTQKKKKELERYINREERKVCEKVKEEIKIYEKVNEINHLNKKRERSASKEEKIQLTEKEFTNSTEKISLQIKAIIGQTLFSTKAYYEIMLPENDALQRALYYIKEGK